MSTVRFQRRQRREVPRSPGGEVTLQPPPEIPRAVPGSLFGKLMPVVMVVGMVGMMALMFTRGGGIASNPMSMMFPMMMIFSMVGMFAGQGGKGQKAAEANEDRKDYLRYLDQVRKDVDETAAQQRAAVEWSHPEPGLIWMLAGTSRMWERRPGDKDFCHARIGLGGQRLATRLVAPETGPVEELEPIAAVSLRRFVRTHSTVPNLPTAIAVKGFATIQLNGDRVQARDMTRAMLLQLCMFQAPDQVLVAVVCGAETSREWEWTKWLPHNQHPEAQDGVGTQRMVFGSIRALIDGLNPLLHNRVRYSRNQPANQNLVHIIIVVDGGLLEAEEDHLRESGYEGVTIIDLCNYAPRLAVSRGIQMVVENGECVGRGATGNMERFALIDRISERQAEQVARRLAPFRVAAQRGGETVAEEAEVISSWAQLMSLGDIGVFNPENGWKPRYGRDRLRVAFGVGADGLPVSLDIKEAAENGMGPHGLCIGATGSGKSEFLRTLVLSLLATHSPDQLNLVLVDFKGGATFLGLEGVPHVAAVITNLEEEADLVDRMGDALRGEMNRRQEVLRQSGNFKNVSEYEEARASGADLDPLPALFVVLDEFSELLQNHPDFADLFVQIGRLGRSLHVHLLLASQRLEEGRLKGLESHLSYRIGLKTFSANESRQVLGVPDAYNLPNSPGGGYLKTDAGEIVRFQASYVSGPYVGGGSQREVTQAGIVGGEIDINAREFSANQVRFRNSDRIPMQQQVTVTETAEEGEKVSNLNMLVSRIRGHGRPAHAIWLPPLDQPDTLDRLVQRSVLTGEQSPVATLSAPIGIVDLPFEQRRDSLYVDLSGARGNVAVVGGPQSGKSTALRTLIMSMALTHTAEQVQFYCLDFGGGTLGSLEGLPHVGSVAGRLDRDKVSRTVSEITTVLRQREVRFRQLGIESMMEFRRLRASDPSSSPAAAGVHEDPFGDVFLVIDGYSSIRQDFDVLEQTIMNLAVQGLSYGVHVVVTLSRWADARPALKDQIGTRIELRLGDPMDSDLGRKNAALVPTGRPGRGMTPECKHMLTALPRVDGNSDPSTLSLGVAAAVEAIARATPGRPAPAVRMLPERFTRDQLLQHLGGWPAGLNPQVRNLQIPMALNEAELAPVFLNLVEHPHFLAFGDTESGKTNLLRGIIRGIVESNTPENAKLIIGDYRRTLLGVVEGRHVAGYAPSSQMLEAMMAELVNILRQRMPGPDVTQQQLRDRSWWSGPEIYVIVDDYDLVVTSQGNPLAVLTEFLAQAKDIGFHLIIARRSGGASRALYEPLISRMKDVNAAGLIMSGNRDEGPLLGNVRPSEMPPGRGVMVTRAGNNLIQVAWTPAP
ncbi:type VII secretion protein EccCa [Nocardia pseudobrasiliensis]|uniref:S-DNA-T family DNA segregation ATPase FtsK/SpoIIIE n=1 Tax=Nocardia pseudobrasiliensis TaxID=45979 RepID=A0A370I149_9NOCA|nr:type VII secretion protein EccCa [Nocardia pseudobrasiliensis]RDI64473.1 S-DNA-T family DNA segregation ATPase FtsK/SpoIIIE [Nocardia pseudobrasiliensis]